MRQNSGVLFLVIERFKNGDPAPVYARFHEKGRQLPDGVTYVSSWTDADLSRCFQIMESRDRAGLDEWMSRWSDLVDFEVVPVVTSAEAAERVLS